MRSGGVGSAPEGSAIADSVHIAFDAGVYSMDTLQRAALKFTDACSFDFRVSAGGLEVSIAPLNASYALRSDELIAKYRNEVLDQHLRAVVAKETENERNLILAHAFSNSKLISS
jgi:His-Xaa-Ser system protein HxsD